MTTTSASKLKVRSEPEPSVGKEQLPSPTIFDKETIQSLPRHYIITQLRKNGHTDIANKLTPVANPDSHVHQSFSEIAANLEEERAEQFADLLNTLALDDSNLKNTYETIIDEMFKGHIHWGRIVTFIVFTSNVVLYCARSRSLKHRVPEILMWTDVAMQEKMHRWIKEQGGWQAFVEHFDLESWRVSLSTLLLGLGASMAVIGGFFAVKKHLQF